MLACEAAILCLPVQEQYLEIGTVMPSSSAYTNSVQRKYCEAQPPERLQGCLLCPILAKRIPLIHIHLGLLADKIGKTTSDSLDGRQSKHNLLLAINICVQHTQNMLEAFICHKALQQATRKLAFKQPQNKATT